MKTAPDVGSLARLLENAGEAIVLATPEGRVLSANAAARLLWDEPGGLDGRRLDDLLRFPAAPADSPADAILLTRGGGRQPVRASRSALAADGDPAVLVVLRAGRSPESAEREISSLIGLLTHDLRAPLANIIGFARLVVQRLPGLSLRGHRRLRRAHPGQCRAARQADHRPGHPALGTPPGAGVRVGGHRRPGRGGPPAARGPDQPGQRHRAVEGEAGRLWCDRIKLQLILDHLLDNALTYCRRDRPPTVVITCSLEEAGIARITVDDNGPGLAPGEESEIFLLFRRGSASRGTKGTGIGLALAAELAASDGRLGDGRPLPRRRRILPGRPSPPLTGSPRKVAFRDIIDRWKSNLSRRRA